MSQQIHPRQFTLVGVAFRCRIETEKFLKGKKADTRYCFELFRRALAEPNQAESKDAWGYIHQHYYDLTISWVRRHKLFSFTGQPADYFANDALTKMWLYFAKGKGRVGHFADLRSLLRFLQLCINSIIVDYYRKHVAPIEPDNEELEWLHAARQRFDTLEREELWRKLYSLTKTELERLWVSAYFELLLPRREIVKLFPQFGTVKEVKKTGDTFMKRAKRNEGLKHFLKWYREG